MTFKEKCIKEYAKNKPDLEQVMRVLYPSDYGYEKRRGCTSENFEKCRKCWDREIPGTEPKAMTLADIERELGYPVRIVSAEGQEA